MPGRKEVIAFGDRIASCAGADAHVMIQSGVVGSTSSAHNADVPGVDKSSLTTLRWSREHENVV